MNDDLPQFDAANLSNNWTEITDTYSLAPFQFVTPVAIQLLRADGKRVVVTGIITSTEDVYEGESTDPTESIIYFQQADLTTIKWSEMKGVLAMVAIPQNEWNEGTNGE